MANSGCTRRPPSDVDVNRDRSCAAFAGSGRTDLLPSEVEAVIADDELADSLLKNKLL
jgi:hypothetical protein